MSNLANLVNLSKQDSYYNKYLKYKNKYLKLKNQIGGAWADIEAESDGEVKCYENSLAHGLLKNDCPNSYYNFAKFDPQFFSNQCDKDENQSKCKCLGYNNVKTDGVKCLRCMKDKRFVEGMDKEDAQRITTNATKLNSNFEVVKACNKINEATKYFINNPIPFAQATDLKTKLKYSSPLTHILLDFNKYTNIAKNLSLQTNKDLICLEGNILYVDKTCKVASGGITSCLFMVLVLDDNTCIVCHMNGLLSNNLPNVFSNYIAKETNYWFTHDTCFNFIKTNFSRVIGKLEKIYLTGVLSDYEIGPNGFIYEGGLHFMYNNIINPNSILKTCENQQLKIQLVDEIKRKLGVNRTKCVDFIFDYAGESANYILANNQLFKMQ